MSEADFSIGAGEFFSMLGPSGCGKTTTLRMIAGFETPTEGAIRLEGVDVSRTPPHKRNVNTVFQHYALFPHMTVIDNVEYPLRQRKMAKAQRREKVAAALRTVGLDGYGKRMPKELSGGQQQRVAFARAMVYEPRVLLMDEPLGALDKKLRDSLQLEIKRIHGELGTTFVYVTHDQDEALVLSDRIAVFNKARIEQIGSPTDLYERPKSIFVARFLGESSLFYGKLEDGLAVNAYGRRIVAGRGDAANGDAVAVVVRPERIRILTCDAEPEAVNAVPGTVIQEIYLGNSRKVEVSLPDGTVALVRESADSITPTQAGEKVWLTFDPDVATILPADT